MILYIYYMHIYIIEKEIKKKIKGEIVQFHHLQQKLRKIPENASYNTF